jgi:hypothetical protein
VVDFSSPYGCHTQPYVIESTTGVSGFTIVPSAGGQVEGNTAVDDVAVLAIAPPVAVEHRSWGGIKALFRP